LVFRQPPSGVSRREPKDPPSKRSVFGAIPNVRLIYFLFKKIKPGLYKRLSLIDGLFCRLHPAKVPDFVSENEPEEDRAIFSLLYTARLSRPFEFPA
jgi:hypothetical protein